MPVLTPLETQVRLLCHIRHDGYFSNEKTRRATASEPQPPPKNVRPVSDGRSQLRNVLGRGGRCGSATSTFLSRFVSLRQLNREQCFLVELVNYIISLIVNVLWIDNPRWFQTRLPGVRFWRTCNAPFKQIAIRFFCRVLV